MPKIDRAIEVIADKDQLHRLIDSMPDDAQAFFLAVDYETGFAKHCVFGNPTSERLVWMVEEFKHWLFATAPEV